jgi:hypothetical protein
MGKGRNAFRILVMKHAGNSPFGIPNRWEDDFKKPIGKMCRQEAKWIQMAQGSLKP